MPTRRASRPSIEPVANSSKKAVASLKFKTSASIDDTITLTSWDGRTITYTSITGSSQHDASVDNKDGILSGTSVMFLTGSTGNAAAANDSSSAASVAQHLKNAITSHHGHGDRFTVYVNGQCADSFASTIGTNAGIGDLYTGSGAIHIIQNKEGVIGNKQVNHTFTGAITGSVNHFGGGKDTTFAKIHNNY